MLLPPSLARATEVSHGKFNSVRPVFGSRMRTPQLPARPSREHLSASTPDLTLMPSPVDEEEDKHTITRPLSMDSRRSSAATIVPDCNDAHTPLPALLSSDANADRQENTRPALPKSLHHHVSHSPAQRSSFVLTSLHATCTTLSAVVSAAQRHQYS
ncbi:hypothetical protein C2E23DRAFT_890556 [Lenzites betulinus]|nr:hypothetical protein C2E23DRAFT_890556 [Lenzites betulinus]